MDTDPKTRPTDADLEKAVFEAPKEAPQGEDSLLTGPPSWGAFSFRAALLHFNQPHRNFCRCPDFPFFGRSASAAFGSMIRAWVTWARRGLGRGELFRASSFSRNQPLSPLAGGCDATSLAQLYPCLGQRIHHGGYGPHCLR